MGLAELRIVLVEPAGPLNLGSIARVMKNFGLNRLILVNPQCDRTSEEALKMAVHAKEVLLDAIEVATLTEALTGCVRIIATIGRDCSWGIPLENPRTTLPWLLAEPEKPVALIFGREDRGLSNTELNYAQKLVYIPTSIEYSSLNLATAVAVCCYELFQSAEISQHQTLPLGEIAPMELVEGYYQQLEALLLAIGYIYPHTAVSRMGKFRHMYNRAHLQIGEVAMLRGILSQVEWALKNQSQPEVL